MKKVISVFLVLLVLSFVCQARAFDCVAYDMAKVEINIPTQKTDGFPIKGDIFISIEDNGKFEPKESVVGYWNSKKDSIHEIRFRMIRASDPEQFIEFRTVNQKGWVDLVYRGIRYKRVRITCLD